MPREQKTRAQLSALPIPTGSETWIKRVEGTNEIFVMYGDFWTNLIDVPDWFVPYLILRVSITEPTMAAAWESFR